jgi:hypothetical protein
VRVDALTIYEPDALLRCGRDEDGAIGVRVLSDSALTLDPPGVAIDLADVFAGV